ncbi:unnamed protein product [Coffea canephora]|uniref:30S ribosomal protein 3, chloroplastic n=2 Tax=Coffea TaxID=13442 RepID=A0A068TZ22_COFCA|nr:30S ribosomal protein 3-1, chloroplastic-like [Coffea arabica]XP_027151735.1 30S ribosomal protein 3-1, chloroplastic-like [Coffea eugenioides]CDP00598.1 unnamed protein product [Coffea canephora]
MLSMSPQSGIKGTLTYPSLPSQNPCCVPFQTSASLKSRAVSPISPTILSFKRKPFSTIQTLQAAATAEEVATETETPAEPSPEPAVHKAETVAKGAQKPKPELVLKFIWMEKNIGLALDQKIPGHGAVPLSPYFFWPRKDAWEELRATLESKSWVSQKKMIILLNQATDIINLWQQSGGNLSQ